MVLTYLIKTVSNRCPHKPSLSPKLININAINGQKIKIDSAIIRYLTVKYKKLDTENEFFKKDKSINEKKQ